MVVTTTVEVRGKDRGRRDDTARERGGLGEGRGVERGHARVTAGSLMVTLQGDIEETNRAE